MTKYHTLRTICHILCYKHMVYTIYCKPHYVVFRVPTSGILHELRRKRLPWEASGLSLWATFNQFWASLGYSGFF